MLGSKPVDTWEEKMKSVSLHSYCVIALLLAIAAQPVMIAQAHAQSKAISIFIVRHAESDSSQATIPLSEKGRQRAT